MGTPIYAMRSGTVKSVRYTTPDLPIGTTGTVDNGNYVLIELDDNDGTNDGYRALYLHLQQNSVTVSPGQHINAGEMIGRVGHNGMSTGPHLHVEINKPYYAGSSSQYGPTIPFEIDGR
jgi:murein DD-endopeptidase MepM/ murein hydrolase activator NlpD